MAVGKTASGSGGGSGAGSSSAREGSEHDAEPRRRIGIARAPRTNNLLQAVIIGNRIAEAVGRMAAGAAPEPTAGNEKALAPASGVSNRNEM